MVDHPSVPTRSRRLAHEIEAGPAVLRGRPVGDHEAKRAKLLRAAVSVIAQEGYAGASLRKVAQRAGCTTGAVTYYFANKEEMVTAVAEGLFDEFDTLLDGREERVDIKLILEKWLEWTNADDPDPWLALFQLVVHARHEPAFAVVFQRRFARFRDNFTFLIARGQSLGVIRSDIPADLLADQIIAMSDGWMITFPLEPERFKPARLQGSGAVDNDRLRKLTGGGASPAQRGAHPPEPAPNQLPDHPVYGIRIPDRMCSSLRWIRRTRLRSGLQGGLGGAVGRCRRNRSSRRATQTKAKGAA